MLGSKVQLAPPMINICGKTKMTVLTAKLDITKENYHPLL